MEYLRTAAGPVEPVVGLSPLNEKWDTFTAARREPILRQGFSDPVCPSVKNY